jgi:hypothetical protein
MGRALVTRSNGDRAERKSIKLFERQQLHDRLEIIGSRYHDPGRISLNYDNPFWRLTGIPTEFAPQGRLQEMQLSTMKVE